MILKVVPRDSDYSRETAWFFEAGRDLTTGTFFFHEPPEKRISHAETMSIEARTTHVLDVATEPSAQDGKGNSIAPDQWLIRFAYWRGDDGGIQLVVTSGAMFLMSERGDTIDRVR